MAPMFRRQNGMRTCEYGLPIVPPLSACYNNVARRGRVPSKRYNTWKAEAGELIVAPDEPLKAVHVRLILPGVAPLVAERSVIALGRIEPTAEFVSVFDKTE